MHGSWKVIYQNNGGQGRKFSVKGMNSFSRLKVSLRAFDVRGGVMSRISMVMTATNGGLDINVFSFLGHVVTLQEFKDHSNHQNLKGSHHYLLR
ncbi:hypothetical protein RSAG8_12563, partial [Rhizoctonia solani AG-8 WAC10335]